MLLGLHTLKRVYRQLLLSPRPGHFPQQVLLHFHTRCYYSANDFKRIPASGASIIVANHPYGAIEGLAILELIRRKRPDVKVLANALLERIPELREDMFFVDVFGSPLATRKNGHALRQALQWVRQGHALILFPAGEVASFAPKAFHIRDPQWHPSMMTFMRLCGREELTILPIFVPGAASLLFHLVGKIHPRLRTLLLPREMLRLHKKTITLRVGSALSGKTLFKRFIKDDEAIQYVRYRTILLGGRKRFSAFDRQMRTLTFDLDEGESADLIHPVSPEAIEAELQQLPTETCLFTEKEYTLYAVRGERIPLTLKEIGRLREYTFRAIGEGTGKSFDADEFDTKYYQLLLWHREKRQIIGCYRLGLSDKLVETYGLDALYTRTLFRFDERFLGHLDGPAIELGRSFVRPEYQRSFAPLLLLWRGVMTFIANHPTYTVLFGPVSITHDYYPASRDLILAYLRGYHYDERLAHWVSPRIPPKHPHFAEWNHPDYNLFKTSESDLNDAILEIEDGVRGVPVLIRQYLKLGGKLCAFNVDPDFGTAIDGLIVVNLRQIPQRFTAKLRI